MRSDLTAVEVLGFAIRSEDGAAEFYGKIAKKVLNSFVRARFESLAREEIGHKKILESLYTKMTGESSPPKIHGGSEAAEGGGAPIDVNDLGELLNFAISREQDASKFYREAAQRTNDMSGKRTLEYLSNIEHGHELMLKTELESYLNDRDWYANNPDVQLVGP